jgi:quinoprotein glucose dehydrogenase
LKIYHVFFVLLLVSVFQLACSAPSSNQDDDWASYGSDKFSSKYSSLDQINKENVKDIEVKWTWESPDNDLKDQFKFPVSIYQVTPLVIDGVLYVSSSTAIVSAINGKTGETIWSYDPETYKSNAPAHGAYIHRGVSYWDDGEGGRIIFGTPDARLIALHTHDGSLVQSFGKDGIVDLSQELSRPFDPAHYGISTPPIIANDVIVIGSSITDASPRSMRPPGDVVGFDAETGKRLWIFHTIPQAGEYGNETWENDSWKVTGNANVWTRMSADEELGYVYLPISTPTNDWYGGNRLGENLFAESLVCLDTKTGERIWHFQMVHHGVWDYDLPAAPNLVNIRVDGNQVKAVAQVSKQGFTYVFDRETGEPIWPIEEKPVPQSTVPGERTSPTQPFPLKPAPFDRQGVTIDDIIDFTPELFEEAWASLSDVDKGALFTPPTENGLIYLPGALGGANWHGAAVDPESGVLYVPSMTFPSFFKIVKSDTTKTDANYEWLNFWVSGPQGLPLFKPPYGRITAIDLNTGEHRWQSPLGIGPRDHPLLSDLNLPRLGWNLRGSPLLTKTLLFIGQEGKYWEYVPALVGGAKLSEVQTQEIINFEPKMQVFDKDNGELIHEIELPLNVTGAPMTYKVDGKQYIAFAVGGSIGPAKIIALALK